MAILSNSNAISSGGYNLTNSLRFRSSASAYLNRTPASAGNRQIWTISFWWKRGVLSSEQYIISADTAGANETWLRINAADTLQFQTFGGTNANLTTSAVFRDPSAWYHIVMAYDSTQATAGNRFKLYVNGTQQTLTGTNPTLNESQAINNTVSHQFCRRASTSGSYADNYLTEVNFIDGQALTPSSFGATDATTGVWQPAKYTGTYGTNGFYLKFSDIATTSGSNAGLGKDFSGNSNYWTTNNISVTSGTTYDAMTDVPTNTSATVANYAVLNPLWKGSVLTLAGANLNVTSSGLTGSALSTIAMESGKYYCEVRLNSSTDATIIGIAISSFNPTTSNLSGAGGVGYYVSNGDKFVNGTQTAYGASCASGDIVGIAVDITAGTITFYKNNVSQGAITHGLTGPFYFATSDVSSTSNIDQSWNFGQRPFSYTPPTGYNRLNTYNLPDSTIKKGNSYMDASLWTGDSTSPRAVVSTLNFKPDFVWTKVRSNTYSNTLYDSVRGGGQALFSDTTGAEQANYTNGYIQSFNSNGWTMQNGGTGGIVLNNSGQTYVAWQWQAGQGTTSSNTSGSITSTVSVNTTAGFSIVTYTGTGANATVGHGLGVAPKMVIVKRRTVSPSNWVVWHGSIPNTDYILLNSTAAKATLASVWNSTSPTSSVFSVGTDNDTNGSTNTTVAYCWADVSGYSKAFSYTGNGSTDGPFVFCNFLPRFVLIKRTDSTSNWYIFDTARNTYNVMKDELLPNSTNAEADNSRWIDCLSNGFKIRNDNVGQINANGGTYIGMAWASNPFKNSLAR